MPDIACIATDLNRAGRINITWDARGISDTASAAIEIEGDGVWHPLEIELIPGQLVGYFAGPDFPSPSPAVVITHTSWCRIRIIDGGSTVFRDGGFIRLIP
jgi:hypothetical protein